MTLSIRDVLADLPFFQTLERTDLDLVAGCGRIAKVTEGTFLAHEGEAADDFYVLRSGRLAVETHDAAGAAFVFQTLEPGEVAGWSWLFPPHRWTFDLRVAATGTVIALDGRCLREKCEHDPRLGYRLMKTFAAAMTERLRAARLQLLDLYGTKRMTR